MKLLVLSQCNRYLPIIKPKKPAGWPGYFVGRVSIMWGVFPFLSAAGEKKIIQIRLVASTPRKNKYVNCGHHPHGVRQCWNSTCLNPTRNLFLKFLGSPGPSGSPEVKTKVLGEILVWAFRQKNMFQTYQYVGMDWDRDLIRTLKKSDRKRKR